MQSICSRTDHPLHWEYRPRDWILARPIRGRSATRAGQAGQPVMAGAARDDGPDINYDVVVDHVVRVVPVHGARGVPGHQGDGITNPQGRPLRGGEDAVLLIETEDGEVVAD